MGPEKVIKKEEDIELEEDRGLEEETSKEELKYSKSLRSRKLLKKETKEDEKKEVKIENDNSKTNNDNDTTLLTADKVMKQDLILLNTPALVNNDLTTNPPKYTTRSKRKSEATAHKDEIKTEEYSSSEEEKQWVTTKEKLLKRLIKKQGDTGMDAAKRAKIVSEFIEKCEATESRKRYSRSRRSRKNFLERQKQLNVLSKELFGETSNETYQPGKKSSQRFGKGRRNIRRVIDKKSLARSTLMANIEEIERKRRLLYRHTKLREMLGCEDGVNVVVINDEMCLEYDFEANRPVVTVHPFFTQVMKAHQYEGVKFMWDACFESLELVGAGHTGGGCILAHCMGLGKTLQVLALLHTVLSHPQMKIQRVLVVCPLSTVLNWVDEINKWMGPVNSKIKVFELSKLKKTYERAYQLEDWYTGGGIFILGYEMFRNLSTLDPILDELRPTIVNKIRKALLDPGPDIIICDEGHLLKNDASVLAVAISRIATKRRIVLTGTPMQNNLREYYCMVNFVKPNLLGLYSEYANRFENPIMNGQHRDSREEDIKLMKARTHILHKVLEGCLQRQEASVLYPYLPKKHEYTVFIPLTKCQTDLYKHYLTHYAKQAKHNVLRDYHILQKIWTHPQVLHNFQLKTRDESVAKVKVEKLEDDLACEDLTASEDVKPSPTEVWWLEYLEGGNMLESLESSNKFFAVFRILDECIALGDKVLIFSTSLITMDALEYFLKNIKKWSLGREYYRLDGSVPPEVRQNWCREFNAPTNQTTNLFLISTRAGCLGLNMTAANRVIILDTSWNPAHDIQSIFRVYRFGQKKDCYIYRIVAMGTMEQKIYERSVTKQAVACRVVDSQQIDRHYNMEELTELYNFDETGSSIESGVAAGVTDVALLRVARDAPLHAVYEHDSLLRDSHDQQLPEHERAAAWRQFEMEQGHSQMENFEQNSLKTPRKNIHGHDYAKSPSQMVDNNKIASKKSTYVRGKYNKRRKPKKNTTKKRILIEENLVKSEETVCIDGNNVMSAMIQQIKNILVEQNINSDFDDSKIQNLVVRVRQAVEASLNGETSHANDALVESIARVFLQSENKDLSSNNQPPNTSIMKEIEEQKEPDTKSMETNGKDEHTDLVESDSTTSKENHTFFKNNKRKRQSGSHEKNNLFSDQRDHIDIDTVVENKKRKAAVKAKEYISSLNLKGSNDSKDDDDEPWSIEDNTSIFDLNQSESDEANIEADLRSCDQIYIDDDSSVEKTEEPKTVTVEIPDEDDSPNLNSIILSDEDTVGETEKNIKDCDKVPNDEKERIPLHASLLKNQHFINMVAYKYLEGNPVLDKDAALHAAHYSAQKALREIEDTGKDLYSGTLYDIAVNSIGMDTLKRLQNISRKCHKSKSDQTRHDDDSSKKNQPKVKQSEDSDVRKSKKDNENKSKQKSEKSKGKFSAKRRQRISSTESDDLVLVSEEVICENPKSKKPVNKKIREETELESLKSSVNQNEDTNTLVPAPSEKKEDPKCSGFEGALHREPERVVPIQLIKRSTNATIAMTRPTTPLTSECILPDDDDDDCFVNDTPTSVSSSKAKPSLFITTVKAGNTNAQSNITTADAVAPDKSNLVDLTTIIPDKDIPRHDGASTIPRNNLENETLDDVQEHFAIGNKEVEQDPNTICLDSDEEDVNNIVPKVIKASILNRPTSSQITQSSFNPVSNSMTEKPTNTVPFSNQTIYSHGIKSKSTLKNTTFEILDSPKPTNINGLSSNDNLSMLNSNTKRMCKPGDIIKITDGGEIVVLNTSQSTFKNVIPEKSTLKTSLPATCTAKVFISNVGEGTFKAVHANTIPQTKAKGPSSDNPSLLLGTPKPHLSDVHMRSGQKFVENKRVLYRPIVSLSTKIPAQTTKTKAKPSSSVPDNRSIETYYTNKKLVPADLKHLKPNNQMVSDYLDLTDTDQVNVTKKTVGNISMFSGNTSDLRDRTTNDMPHKSNIKSSLAVIGSPKDFVIMRAGEKTKLVPATAQYTTPRKRKESTMPVAQVVDATKKLTTSEEAGPSKKTKIQALKKLTLQDFNIDKIDDDIIELD